MKVCFILLLAAVVASSLGLRIERQAPTDGGTGSGLDIYNLYVTSDIRHRFATTLVTSRVANRDSEAREVTFYMQLPNEAFISNFTMEIGGEVRVGEVQEKEKAEKRYQAAKAQGHTAGQAKAVARQSNSFKVSVNLAAHDLVTFNLTYQELLPRRLGIYEHVININPGQIVHDMRIRVTIDETVNITKLKVPQLRENFQGSSLQQEEDNEMASIYRPTAHSAEIFFEPTEEEQRNMSRDGIVGQFAVQYDVQRSSDAGEVELVNGYFVHYFAPTGLNTISKDILFVLDISGSMYGRKIDQVRQSMNVILGELREGDRFNVLLFSSDVRWWKGTMQPVNTETIQSAKSYIASNFGGGTNILRALQSALDFMEQNINSDNVPTIIFLTDGQGGSHEIIMREVKSRNEGQIPIFALAYGRGADWDFLKQLSLQNNALARKIYEESDASLQLSGFYREVASPLLRNVTFNYVGQSVDTDSLTNTDFNTFYSGNELVVAGKLNLNALSGSEVGIQVVGASSAGPVTYMSSLINCSPGIMIMDARCPATGPAVTLAPATSAPTNGDSGALAEFTERLWAYLTIKEVLKKSASAASADLKKEFKEKALELSLKYHFVTQLTSMIVVQDNATEARRSELNEEDASSRRTNPAPQPARHHPSPTSSRGHGFVTSDPHILTVVGGIPVCFNLYGDSGQEYLLFEDKINDITVYGTLKTSKTNPNATFFNVITAKSEDLEISFNLDFVDPLYPSIKGSRTAIAHKSFKIRRTKRRDMDVIFRQGLTLSVHLGKHGKDEKLEHFLGVYFNSKPIYTEVCEPERFRGVVGQFMCDAAEVLPIMAPPVDLDKDFKSLANIARLRVWDDSGIKREAFAAAGFRHNFHKHRDESCWFVHDQGDQIMKHSVASYQVIDRKSEIEA